MIIYIILIVTFILLGLLSLFKGIKEGIMASTLGAIITSIIGLLHLIYNKVTSLFGKYQLTLMDFFTWILIIALGIIIFIILSFIIKVSGKNKKGNIRSKGFKR